MDPQNTLFHSSFDAYYYKGTLDALPNRGQRVVIKGKLYGVHDVATDVEFRDVLIRLDVLATTGMEKLLEPKH